MRIAHIHIENFRSIRNLDVDCPPLMTFIGPNNNGKSNILLAIAFFFNQYKLTAKDFFIKGETEQDQIVVEVIFNELDEQDRTTFKRYVKSDDTITVRRVAFFEDGDLTIELHGVALIPKEDWLNAENAKKYSKKEELEKLKVQYPQIVEMLPSAGRMTIEDIQNMQSQYIEKNKETLTFLEHLESQPFLGVKNVGDNIFGEFILFPAIRDISSELMATEVTSLGRLFNHALKDLLANENIKESEMKFNQIISDLKLFSDDEEEKPEKIKELENEISKELESWKCKIKISLPPPEFEDLFGGKPHIIADDGVQTDINYKGHGLQRYFMFCLIQIWAKRLQTSEEKTGEIKPRLKSTSLYFAIEEPELFLHPQAQREMLSRLRDLSKIDNHQIMFCTHSSCFVDMDSHKSICVVTKKSIEDGTKILQLQTELFQDSDRSSKKQRLNMAYWFNPDRSELFFSRKVALVEGQSEKVLFPFLASRLNIFDENVCIVDCGGKGNIPLYQEILNAFGLQYIAIHDEDPISVPEGDQKYAHQKRMYSLNTEIIGMCKKPLSKSVILCPNLDMVCGISPQSEYKVIRLLEAFEDSTKVIPNDLEKIIRGIYSK